MTEKINKGECFQVAGRLILDKEDEDNWILVHATVEGQGELKGQRINHAWVEVNGFVLDFSNGLNVACPLKKYYKVGKPSKIKKYSVRQAKDLMLKTGKFGEWKQQKK